MQQVTQRVMYELTKRDRKRNELVTQKIQITDLVNRIKLLKLQ